MKYNILLNILDQIRNEAPAHFHLKYHPSNDEIDKINQARSRAYIHLFLKVSFGLLDFKEREHYVTDGTQDAGIDGYFINEETKMVYFLQSKFRTTEANFESKEITLEELLAMDIERVTSGENCDEYGIEYSGKIKQLQREIAAIPDISRYAYKIVIIANLKNIPVHSLKKLCGGYPPEIFDCEKCYQKLVFPVITGTYFNASDLKINIDLSNKNAGSKISYTVKTKISECDITVLFVPTIELAKIMSKYKNSILKYNPRSYLELDGQSVHQAIRDTIMQTKTNEFALFNNGITMLSEETFINEKIGQKNKAQLMVKNPQILNGGQTCYTLSRIYEENLRDNVENLFRDKEVLLKVITLRENSDDDKKLELIDEISNATNKQTPVINADKYANELIHIKLQKMVFDNYGLLYERKRGEFADGIYNGYINKDLIIERNLFLRLFYASNGDINKGIQKRLFQKNDISIKELEDVTSLKKFYIGYHVFKRIWEQKSPYQKATPHEYAKVYLYTQVLSKDTDGDWLNSLDSNITKLNDIWKGFIESISIKYPPKQIERIDRKTGEKVIRYKKRRYNFLKIKRDLEEYLTQQKIESISDDAN